MLAFYGVGGAALATSLAKLRRRLELSQAKHKSLIGHSRLSRRFARLIPFYEYDEARFFCCDGAPPDVAARRRDGFDAPVRALSIRRFAKTIAQTAEAAGCISDLQFTDAYRVPFQFSRVARRICLPAIVSGSRHRRHCHRSRWQHLLRSHRIVRRQPVRPRLLQGLHRARRGACARPRSRARRLSPR